MLGRRVPAALDVLMLHNRKTAYLTFVQATAIANYTQRVNDPSLDATQNMQALYFIDHVSCANKTCCHFFIPLPVSRRHQNQIQCTMHQLACDLGHRNARDDGQLHLRR
jgi:hypothetical protein